MAALFVGMLRLSDAEIKQCVEEAVATVSRQQVRTLPLSKLLVRELGLSGAEAHEVLRAVEARLKTVVLDGIHMKQDFTVGDIVEFYGYLSRLE